MNKHEQNASKHQCQRQNPEGSVVCRWEIETWELEPFEHNELTFFFKKPVWDELSFETCCIFFLEIQDLYTVVIKGWTFLNCCQEVLSFYPEFRFNEPETFSNRSWSNFYWVLTDKHNAWLDTSVSVLFSRRNVHYNQKWYSPYFSCNELLFPPIISEKVFNFSLRNKIFSSTQLLLLLCLNYPNYSVWHKQPCHV